jgi:hypothetical protein
MVFRKGIGLEKLRYVLIAASCWLHGKFLHASRISNRSVSSAFACAND